MMPEPPSNTSEIFGFVPAGGKGARFGASVPKQYLSLRGRPVIAHAIDRLCADRRVRGVGVGVASDDLEWSRTGRVAVQSEILFVSPAGATRADTVRLGMEALIDRGHARDWVLVHDAARPCVRPPDISRLIDAVLAAGEGGILAAPLADTLKRMDRDGRSEATLSRAGLFRAFTPQMFRVGSLFEALRRAHAAGVEVTDEAEAMERMGERPLLIATHADNLKITTSDDLPWAESILAAQEQARCG